MTQQPFPSLPKKRTEGFMLPRHTEGPLASLRAPGRPPKLATAPSHGLLCDPQTHIRHLEYKSGCLGPLFFPTRKSPRPPGGPLPLPGSSKESTGTGRGSPAPQLSSPTPTLPLSRLECNIFISGGRPGDGGQGPAGSWGSGKMPWRGHGQLPRRMWGRPSRGN